MSLITIVLTSSSVAVLVSSLITILEQYLERRARINELIFTKALDIAINRTETLMRAAKDSGASVKLPDNVVMAETYYCWLKHLFNHGKLPQEAKDASLKTVEEG